MGDRNGICELCGGELLIGIGHSDGDCRETALTRNWAQEAGKVKALELQLSEARTYAAPVDAKASVPRLKPCEHSEYWTTHFGACMACRAVDAERLNGELKLQSSELRIALRAVLDEVSDKKGIEEARAFAREFLTKYEKPKCVHDGGPISCDHQKPCPDHSCACGRAVAKRGDKCLRCGGFSEKRVEGSPKVGWCPGCGGLAHPGDCETH